MGRDCCGPQEPVAAPPQAPIIIGIVDVWTALQYAKWDRVMECIGEDPSIINGKDASGAAPLHWAVWHGRPDLCKHFLMRGAQIDAVNENIQTPLQWAANKGHVFIMRMLIEAGANIDHKDSLGATAAMIALQHKQTLAFLHLLKHGADLNIADVNGCTCVHWSCYLDNLAVLQLLQARGCDMLAPDALGNTPLHRAVEARAQFTTEYLAKLGLGVNVKNKEGSTPLVLAASCLANAQGSRKKQQHPIITLLTNPRNYFLRKKAQDWLNPGIFFSCVIISMYAYLARVSMVAGDYTTLNLVFLLLWTLLVWTYIKMLRSDAGTVGRPVGKVSEEVMQLVEVVENGMMPIPMATERICTSCWIVKPLRSKHCRACDRCVPKFDHHCVWVRNCVGADNHRLFVSLLIIHHIAQLCFLTLAFITAYRVTPDGTAVSTFLWMMCTSELPLGLSMFVNILVGFWILALCGQQMQFAASAMTTNEMMNRGRYRHFWRPVPGAAGAQPARGGHAHGHGGGAPGAEFHNPFSRGSWIDNCLAFWELDGLFNRGGHKLVPSSDVGDVEAGMGMGHMQMNPAAMVQAMQKQKAALAAAFGGAAGAGAGVGAGGDDEDQAAMHELMKAALAQRAAAGGHPGFGLPAAHGGHAHVHGDSCDHGHGRSSAVVGAGTGAAEDNSFKSA